MLLPELQLPTTPLYSTAPAANEPEATFEINGHEIKFRVDGAGVLRASTGGEKKLDLDTSDNAKVDFARVSSMDLSVGPDGDVYFLALAVNSKIDWPGTEDDRNSAEFMKINE